MTSPLNGGVLWCYARFIEMWTIYICGYKRSSNWYVLVMVSQEMEFLMRWNLKKPGRIGAPDPDRHWFIPPVWTFLHFWFTYTPLPWIWFHVDPLTSWTSEYHPWRWFVLSQNCCCCKDCTTTSNFFQLVATGGVTLLRLLATAPTFPEHICYTISF